jgi:predicted TIM-barrel fold metal-dependent hydrolase
MSGSIRHADIRQVDIRQVDTHTHVVAADEAAYPLDPPQGMTAPWYREDPCSVERLLALMGEAEVDRAVLVQGISAYGFDNRYTVDSARRFPKHCSSVVYLDLATGDRPNDGPNDAPSDGPNDGPSDAVGELRRLVRDEGVRGLRWVAFGETSLTEPSAVWSEAAALGIPVVVTVLADKLEELAAMIPSLPGAIPLALDHCGFADFSSGIPDALLALVEFPTLHLKASTIALDHLAAHGDVRDGMAELAARFGADRLMWGSDYSQTHDRPYPELAEYARHAASRLDDAARAAFLAGTALALWPELAG